VTQGLLQSCDVERAAGRPLVLPCCWRHQQEQPEAGCCGHGGVDARARVAGHGGLLRRHGHRLGLARHYARTRACGLPMERAPAARCGDPSGRRWTAATESA
jgi:hypothetical protein